jgi:hypothetical protein
MGLFIEELLNDEHLGDIHIITAERESYRSVPDTTVIIEHNSVLKNLMIDPM